MIKITDKIKSVVYRLLRSDAPNTHNACDQCKKCRRNWAESSVRRNQMIAYDKILGEWVMFSETNMYAKTWIINGYITNLHDLTDKAWNEIRFKCRHCISKFFDSYKDPEDTTNEASPG